MTEQNYNVDQSQPVTTNEAAPQESVQARQSAPQMNTTSAPVNEVPSGDMQVKTPYDYLKETFQREVENDPVTLEIPKRPGIYIEFDTNITSEQVEMWRKQATVGNRRSRRGGGEQEIDSVKFAALVVFHKANVFVVDGEEVLLPPGNKPLNFFEQTALKTILNTNAVTDTELVRAVYANDAHVMAAGSQVVEEAGYGEELAEMNENPTKR